MEWTKWKKHIFEEPLHPLYIVYGEEEQLQLEIFQAFRNRAFAGGMGDWNWNVLYGHKDMELAQFVEAVAGAAWGPDNRIAAVRTCDPVPADTWNALAQWLEHNEAGSTLVLFFHSLDGRLKGIKKLRSMAQVWECQQYKGDALLRYIMDHAKTIGVNMEQDAAQELARHTGPDLSFVVSELEKLALYVYPSTTIDAAAVDAAASLAPGQTEQGAVFKMTEAMAAKNCREAVRLLHELIDAGEAPLRLLPLIDRELRLLLAARSRHGQPWASIAQAMGENSDYPVKKAGRYSGRFSEDTLLKAFHKVVLADRDMKLGANGEDVLEELVTWICRQE